MAQKQDKIILSSDTKQMFPQGLMLKNYMNRKRQRQVRSITAEAWNSMEGLGNSTLG